MQNEVHDPRSITVSTLFPVFSFCIESILLIAIYIEFDLSGVREV